MLLIRMSDCQGENLFKLTPSSPSGRASVFQGAPRGMAEGIVFPS